MFGWNVRERIAPLPDFALPSCYHFNQDYQAVGQEETHRKGYRYLGSDCEPELQTCSLLLFGFLCQF
jgi:hypothetical protein